MNINNYHNINIYFLTVNVIMNIANMRTEIEFALRRKDFGFPFLYINTFSETYFLFPFFKMLSWQLNHFKVCVTIEGPAHFDALHALRAKESTEISLHA